jgi:hypothetical protein
VTLVYPRLPASTAHDLLAEYSPLTIAELEKLADDHNDRSDWYPTGPRVATRQLRLIADTVRSVAAHHGYPEVRGEKARAYVEFDQQVGPELYRAMDIAPADAAHDGVWSFLALVLLPDVALWRFPNRERKPTYDRIIGTHRHVFGRLWWRSHTFGAGSSDPSGKLLEDEAVNIMERPTLAGDHRVASIMARAHLRALEQYRAVSRTALMRDAAKRTRRLTSVVTLGALPDAELTSLFDGLFTAAGDALHAAGHTQSGEDDPEPT